MVTGVPVGASAEDFLPYRPSDSGRTAESVLAQVDRAVWLGYGPDRRVGGINKVVAAPLFDFVLLLRALTSRPDLRFVTNHEMVTETGDPHEVRVTLRHDIDSDISAALQQARIEEEFGVPATWLVLHTAPYYGSVGADGTFTRHNAMAGVYRELQERGHEVALHTDPLGLYQQHGIDGAAAVVEELRWLRSHGIEVRGATAHNHRPTYGAENYEAFTRWVSPASDAQPADATMVEHDGKRSPLRVLDPVQLGLEYEGNQVFWDHPRPVLYAALRGADRWNLRPHRRYLRRTGAVDLAFTEQARVEHAVLTAAPGTDVVLVIHPEYYGLRHEDGPPALQHVAVSRSPGLGEVECWTPGSLVAVCEAEGDRQISQSINVANEWGMTDLPVADRPSAERQVVVLGADQVDASHLADASAVTGRLRELADGRVDGGVEVFKVAAQGASIADLHRLWSAICTEGDSSHATHATLPRPINSRDVVIVGVDEGLVARGASDPRATPLAALEELYWAVRRHGAQVVFLVTESNEVQSLDRRLFLDRLDALGTCLGAGVVAPQAAQRSERERLGLPRVADRWNPTDHRVAAVELFHLLFGQEEPPPRSAAELTDQEPPTDADVAEQRRLRTQLGLLDHPVPFTGSLAIVSDIDGSATSRYRTYMHELVDRLGLDHGDSIHVAGYHQRHLRSRAATNNRAILRHDLTRDNGPLREAGSWLAHVAREFHAGNIDHFHGLWAWGARTLPLEVSAESATVASLRPDGLKTSSAGNQPGFAYDAKAFPLVSVVIETTADQLPPIIHSSVPVDTADGDTAVRARPKGLRAAMDRIRSNRTNPPTDSETAPTADDAARIELILQRVQETGHGTRLATWSTQRRVLKSMATEPTVVVGVGEWDRRRVHVAVDPASIVGAALHNIDTEGLDRALAELRRGLHIAARLVTAHGRYHLFTIDAFPRLMGALDQAIAEADGWPVARYGAPAGLGPAASAVADDPGSPGHVMESLARHGIRHVTPAGRIMASEATFSVDSATFPVADRSGGPTRFLQRTRPAAANHATVETSRLSTFETRLRTVLDQLDGGADGVWPIYTHLGQIVDLDAAPDPWFPDGVVDELAQRYFGSSHAGSRPWVARASVLAAYCETLQTLPAVTSRRGDRLEVRALTDESGVMVSADRLYGVSFSAADPAVAAILFDGQELPLVRWLDRKAITAVPCGIGWPLIGSVDPVVVASPSSAVGAESDLAHVSVDGSWRWHGGDDAHGELCCDAAGRAAVQLDLGALDVAGAQVLFADLGCPTGAEVTITVRGVGGAEWVASTGQVEPRTGVGRFDLGRLGGERSAVALPLWGFEWEGNVPDGRRVVSVAVEVRGEPDAVLEIRNLRLGRPGERGRPAGVGPRVGGDASGCDAVRLCRLGERGERLEEASVKIAVESDGFFATPPLEVGLWLVERVGALPADRGRVLLVEEDRFDVDLRDPGGEAQTNGSNE